MDKYLIPALVAAFVTLAVEYAAKPRLEARKERLLERNRDTRAAVQAVNRCSYIVGRGLAHDNGPVPLLLRDDLREQLAIESAALRSAIMNPLNMSNLVEQCLLQFSTAVGAWAYMTTFEVEEDSTWEAEFLQDIVTPLSDLAQDAVALRWWQHRKRKEVRASLAAVASAREGMDETQG